MSSILNMSDLIGSIFKYVREDGNDRSLVARQLKADEFPVCRNWTDKVFMLTRWLKLVSKTCQNTPQEPQSLALLTSRLCKGNLKQRVVIEGARGWIPAVEVAVEVIKKSVASCTEWTARALISQLYNGEYSITIFDLCVRSHTAQYHWSTCQYLACTSWSGILLLRGHCRHSKVFFTVASPDNYWRASLVVPLKACDWKGSLGDWYWIDFIKVDFKGSKMLHNSSV